MSPERVSFGVGMGRSFHVATESEMMQRALGPTVKGLAGTDSEKLAKHQIKFKVIISFKCVCGN